jgi:hypothetical protein
MSLNQMLSNKIKKTNQLKKTLNKKISIKITIIKFEKIKCQTPFIF